MRKRWLGAIALLSVLVPVAGGCSKKTESGGGGHGLARDRVGKCLAPVHDARAGHPDHWLGHPVPAVRVQPGGTLTGFHVELMDAVAQRLGLTPKWVNANFNTIFTALSVNKFDVVASAVTAYAPKGSPAYETTQKRAQIVAFTKPYYDSLRP